MISGVCMGCGVLSKYGLQLALGRTLGISDYGLFAQTFACSQIAGALCVLGLDVAAVRFLPVYIENGSKDTVKQFWSFGKRSITLCGSMLALIAFVVSLTGLKTSAPLATLTAGLLLGVVVAGNNFRVGVLRGLGCPVSSLLTGHVYWPFIVTSGVVGLGWLGWEWTAWQALVFVGFVYCGVRLAQDMLIKREIVKSLPLPSSQGSGPAVWRATIIPYTVISIASKALLVVDVIIVGWMLGETIGGGYAAAAKIASIVSFAVVAVLYLAAPAMSRAFAVNAEPGVVRIARRTSLVTVLLVVILIVPLGVWAEPVLRLFGDGYAEYAAILRILLWGHLAAAIGAPSIWALLAVGRESIVLRIDTVTVLATVCMGIWGAAINGCAGVAVVVCLGLAARSGAGIFWARHKLGEWCVGLKTLSYVP